jgi:DNA transposition AAA+ family ATPase
MSTPALATSAPAQPRSRDPIHPMHGDSPAPRSASSVYTPQDLDQVAAIKKWLAAHEKSNAWLGKKASIPNGTLSQILSLKYVSSPTKQLNQLASVLAVETARMQDGPEGYVETSVHQLMRVVFDRARKHQNFGVVSGYVGVGKTSFCKTYRSTAPMTLLVEANPNMTPGVFLEELLAQLNAPMQVGLDRKFREVVRVLSGTNYLIVADEAEKLSSNALEYLRRIRDKAQVGVALVGSEKLTALLSVHHGQFDQVRSRVGMWPRTIERITRDDCDALARSALSDFSELSDDVLDALWGYCEGSARVLVEVLVPALRDYSPGKDLSAKIVDGIAQKVIFLAPRKQDGKAEK